jgi:broad specificity phosphatase PhoE
MPDNQVPLSDTGRAQADAAGKTLRGIIGNEQVAFFVSPFLRSRQTFEHIAESFDRAQYIVREDPRLREQEWGNLQHPDEAFDIARQRTHVGRFYYRFPTGESGTRVLALCYWPVC